MNDSATVDLVRELVFRLLSFRDSSIPSHGDSAAAAVSYAIRLLSSRMSPSVLPDELSLVESIKRRLATTGRSSAALNFAELHSKLSTRAPRINRWALLYLLNSLSVDRRWPDSSPSGGLPFLSLQPYNTPRPAAPCLTSGTVSGGVLFLSKDPENIREIALREYADLVIEDNEVTESALVRDVLYVCQGIDGRYIRFDRSFDGYDLPETLKIPRPTRYLVRRLSELGWLFRRVRGYILESIVSQQSEVGTVGQAFCSALQDELLDYYKLLAVLESQSSIPIPSTGSDYGGCTGNYLSLRRLAVWLAEPTVRMRLMASLVDSCQELRGGAMAGAIHGLSQHGDPLVQEFMGRLLRRICSPIFETVRTWVLEGELEDVFAEFFILSQPVKAESLWREGYEIQSSMLPSFISPLLAQRIFRTGKSINFLRVCCEDNGWAEAALEAAAQVGATTRRGGIGYGETDALEALAVEAAKRIDRHLMNVIFKRYRFKDHCLAIKRYLLLGQGDFVQYLMDIVGPELSAPANTISSFQLAGLLETAIRSSNALYDDCEILDRLKVRMMEYEDGDRGWDVFSLEYDARVPLDTVFTALNMRRYLKIFNFLWKLKRVEHALTGLWKTMKPNYINSCIFTDESFGVKLQFVSVLRRCQVLWNEMNHFVTNFQYYVMFEVLEESWVHFSEGMDSSKDLDDLLNAHDKYLSSIVDKSLLGERSQGILRYLFVLFDHILGFCSLADRWFDRIYELQLRRKNASRSNSKSELYKSGLSIDGGRKVLLQLARDLLGKMSEDLDTVAKEYSAALDTFISQLPLQHHIDLKFLLFRLDFTEYYSRVSSGK